MIVKDLIKIKIIQEIIEKEIEGGRDLIKKAYMQTLDLDINKMKKQFLKLFIEKIINVEQSIVNI